MRKAHATVLGIVLLVGCHRAAPEKTLADVYPDHTVYSPGALAPGEIAIEGAGGAFGASVAIGRLHYSEDALILLKNARAASGPTVRDLARQIAAARPPLPAVKCSTTWVYANESVVKDDCVLSADTALMASYQEQMPAFRPGQPLVRARLAPGLRDSTFYRCRYKVKGAIVCQNSCAIAGTVTCEFQSADGLIVIRPATQPNRDADSTTSVPCNSKNQCD